MASKVTLVSETQFDCQIGDIGAFLQALASMIKSVDNTEGTRGHTHPVRETSGEGLTTHASMLGDLRNRFVPIKTNDILGINQQGCLLGGQGREIDVDARRAGVDVRQALMRHPWWDDQALASVNTAVLTFDTKLPAPTQYKRDLHFPVKMATQHGGACAIPASNLHALSSGSLIVPSVLQRDGHAFDSKLMQ
ncbi:MAG TPA: hypothetical protein VGC62_19040 [Pseudomonas sp.]